MRKNNIKKQTIFLIIVWLICLVIIPIIVLNIEKKFSEGNSSYLSADFEIENYDITLDVDKDNKVDVTEVITINIPEGDYNGIYKSIPIWQKYYNKDFKMTTKKVKVTNLRVIGEKYVLHENSNNIGIRIGSNRFNVESGEHTYIIKYRYDMGQDPNKNYDEFVFNIFDNYDNTKINNIDFSINMPKEFDENKVQFFQGNKDVKNYINYTIDGNTLKASLKNYPLDSSLTINFTLNEDYFVGGGYSYSFYSLFICIIIIIISISSFVSWKKYGKDNDKKVQTVEFYSPDDLDSAQVGYVYGEQDIKKLTVSLIISLASKGYVSINETANKKFEIINIGKNNDKLKKLSITEQIVYLELFKNSDTNLLYADSSFPVVFGKVEECLNAVIDKKINDQNSKRKMQVTFGLLVFSIILWTCAYLFIKDLNPKLNVLYIISFISIFMTGFFSIFMNRKTSYGEIIHAKVLGFKNYLATAEKNKLEALVLENPNYFYDILPFTYVLGVSDKWIKTFGKQNITNIDLNSIQFYETGFFTII